MTREFERGLLNGIPQHEAANFFLRIKHAGWMDAPDETGVLEGQFAAPIEQVVASLSEAAASKFKLMVAYHIFAESMRGLAQHAIGEVFHEHAEHERAAAEAYLKRATVLGGGPVHLPEIETPPASSDPVGIIMMMARAEQEAIALQTELRLMVGETNPLGFQIEAFMVEDQHHLDELWQLLPQDVARTPVIDQAPAGAEMGLPEAAVEEAEVAAPVAEEAAAETAPSPELKQAFARGLKLAGIATDIIGDMSPEDKGKLLRQEKLRGLADAVPLQAKKLVSRAGEIAQPLMTRSGKNLLGGGTVLGGLMGMSSGASMDKKQEKELRAGGPISRFRADHPVVTGAGMGAASAGSALAGGLMVPKKVALLGALAAGMAPGAITSAVDKSLKRREDSAKVAFALGLRKIGFAPPEPGAGTDPGSAPIADTQQAVVPQPSMAQPGVQPPMATPPGGRQYDPTNYLEAEETAQRVQEENEAQFYRGKAQEATGQVQSMGAQVQDIQAQLDQLSAQAAESQNQILAANEEAVRANDNMLNQATLAARMRMGMQQLRAQMMEIASQDPEQLAAAAGGPTPMDVGAQAQQAAAGPAGAPPPPPGGDPAMGGAPPGDPNAPPAQPGAPGDPAAAGGPPAEGGSPEPKKPEGEGAPKKEPGGETTVSIKKGSAKTADIYGESMKALPFLAGGAALGAGAGYMSAKRGKDIPNLREQVDALKGQQDGGFGKAIELGKAQVSLGQAEEARANPGKSAIRGGLMGASLATGLATAVPAAVSGGKQLFKNLSTVAGNMRGA